MKIIKETKEENIYWILQVIRHLKTITPLGGLINFDGSKLKRVSISDQVSLLSILEGKGVLRLSVSENDSKKNNLIFREKVTTLPCYIEITEPKFQNICIKYERVWRKKIKNGSSLLNILKDEFNTLSPVEVTTKEIEKFMTEERDREIDEIIKDKKENKKNVIKIINNKKSEFKFSLPEMTKWDKVLLKIKDGLQDIEIWYDGKHIRTMNYIELGFSATKKEHKPDMKWHFLCILSVLQNEDIKQATPNNLMSMLSKHSNRSTKIGTVHQTKKMLSLKLRGLFSTSDNPFTINKKYYEPIFKILPESLMREKELWRQGGKLNENINYDNNEEELN